MKYPPWKAVRIKDAWDVTNDAGDPGEEYSILEDPDEDTARLIAAAPDLLVAIQRLDALLDFSETLAANDFGIAHPDLLNEAFANARAAIVKAKGA